MLRKILLISVFALCATLYAYAPEWSTVNAQGTLPTAQPLPEDFGDSFTGVSDPGVPTTSDDLEFSPTNGGEGSTENPATVGTDPDTGNTVGTFPVGFTNTSDGPLDNVVLTTPLGDGQSLPDGSPWTDITLPDGTRVAAFNAGTLAPGESIEIPVTIVDNDLDAGAPIELPTRLDATDGEGNDVSLAGIISHIPQAEAPVSVPLPGGFAEALPDTATETFAVPENPTTDLAFIPTDGSDGATTIPSTVDTDPNTGETTVILPVGFTDGSRVAAFNLGSLAAGNTAEIPFVFNSNNVAADIAGTEIALPTRLDATSGGVPVTLTGEVAQTPLAPTALAETDEPSQGFRLFLPIISQ